MSPSMDNSKLNDFEKHASLVKTLSEFDLVDIGHRVPELAQDLKDVKNILVTGGAGFM
jgi:hypothetical protein